jgi:hypothetical protein
MRPGLVLVAVAACSPGGRDVPADVDASTPVAVVDAPDVEWHEPRQVTGVIVGDQRVLWSQRHESCWHESPFSCIEVGPTLSMRDVATGTVSTLFADRMGADSLVGDEDEVFMVLGMGETDHDQRYVARFRPGISTAPEPMSAPTNDSVTLLFADTTHVYWRITNSAKVYRASRTGDGSDATVVSTGVFVPTFSFNGYYWAGKYRVPMTGGAVEQMSSIDVTYPFSTTDGIYAGKAVDGDAWSVGVLGADDVYQPVLASIPTVYKPYDLVVAGDELFWTSADQRLYRARAGDSTISTGPVLPGEFRPFGVTADEILYNFTRNGYETAPR